MKRQLRLLQSGPVAGFTLLALALAVMSTLLTGAEPSLGESRTKARSLMEDGNFAEALDQFRIVLADPENKGEGLAEDLQRAVQCLARLNRFGEFDELVEQAVEVHAEDWWLLWRAAELLPGQPNHGSVIDGVFRRNDYSGQVVSSAQRDRVRSLQLFLAAEAVMPGGAPDVAKARFYNDFAAAVDQSPQAGGFGRRGRGGWHGGGSAAWRWQILTDLEALPDPLIQTVHQPGGQGHPVTEEGEPVYFAVPESWEAAVNDGERWRWLKQMQAQVHPERADDVALELADRWRSFFGVSTLGHEFGSLWHARRDDDEGQTRRDGIASIHTLEENETIARLATGIRRFELPEGYRFVEQYRKLAASDQKDVSASALERLAGLFTDRRQYVTAAEMWKEAIRLHGPGTHNHRREQLHQIVGNLGRFDGTLTQPSGTAASVGFVFRNAEQAAFTARPVDIDGLLKATREYLESNPQEFDHQRIQVEHIGHFLVRQQQAEHGRHHRRFLGEVSHEWSVDLDPADGHWDRRIVVDTPLDQPGAWLVEVELKDGNKSAILVWVADTVLVRKPTEEGFMYLLRDAVDGRPVAGAEIQLFGFEYLTYDRENQRPLPRGQRQTRVRKHTLTTDGHGHAFHSLDGEGAHDQNMQWLEVARTGDGRMAFLGFDRVWRVGSIAQPDLQQRGYLVTDRPVYRPGHEVNLKAWLRTSGYGEGDAEPLAGLGFELKLMDPQGNEVVKKNLVTNRHGGADTTHTLADDAMLGVWTVMIQRPGMFHSHRFRVEEYRTPEFEVLVDAPDKPVTLGDSFEVTISANYYTGGPVRNGTVRYKVERQQHRDSWFPPMPWDWLYGRGYGWLLPLADWYPGFERWCIVPPPPPWNPWNPEPPELVAENEVEIGPDGTVKIEIDSAEAKELHGDRDHRYTISVEVTDASRRVIDGSGQVIAARRPFQVLVSPNRGFYQTGDRATFMVHARTPDGRPVSGTATLRLLAQSYDADGNPREEQEIESVELEVGGDNDGRVDLVMARAGQFRVAATVTTEDGAEQEGGVLLLVREGAFKAEDFRFGDLELIPDKAEYAPGETVQLLINSDRENATVALFPRAQNGVYGRPELITLEGKSGVFELPLADRDQPNIFVEAVLVSDAKVHTVTREIAIPPVSRVLELEIEPKADEVQPGSETEVTIRLTDVDGKPYRGELAISVYDRAIDAIAGDMKPVDIREHFWGWKRHHSPTDRNSLARATGNLNPHGSIAWSALGMFGATAADDGDMRRMQALRGEALDAFAPPAPAAAMADGAMLMEAAAEAPAMRMQADAVGLGAVAKADGAPSEAEVTIRGEFADLAFWSGSVETDADGRATVSFKVPDNLTSWSIGAWAVGEGTAVGHGSGEFVSTKKLRLRPQLPRFLTQTDRVTLSAVVHNGHEVAQTVRLVTELEGGVLAFVEAGDAGQSFEIPAGGEHRFDLEVAALEEGAAMVRMKAMAELESDGTEIGFPVHVHGMLKTEAWSGVVRPDQDTDRVVLTVPQQRRPEQSRLEIRWSPTIAGALVDALPYLVASPRGSTDQTLHRFVPTVVAHRTLIDLGLDLAAIREQRVNLNPQELGDPAERAAQWGRRRAWEDARNPVFSEAEVARMTREGVAALAQMQVRDGGWGWFSGYGERSWPHTTATVVRGLRLAVANGADVDDVMLAGGTAWLERYEADQVRRMALPEGHRDHKRRPDATDALVHLTLVEGGRGRVEMRARLYQDRLDLPRSAQAMTGLACALSNENERRDMIIRNLSQFIVRVEENQTAYLDLGDIGHWRWFWWGDEIETNCYYLKLLALTDPKGEDAAGLAKFLLNNRKNGNYWRSTRDTALAIEALALFMRESGEAEVDLEFDLVIDGEVVRTVTVTPENLFRTANTFVLDGDDLKAGEHTVEFRRRGTSPLYFNVYSTNFTLEDFISAAGLEVKVDRRYYRMVEVDVENLVAGQRGQVVEQAGRSWLREPLENGAELTSGDRVEVELRIESLNDYEYLMFEDVKAAGLEPVEVRSGYVGDGRLHAYLQLRDREAVFFVQSLPRGNHTLRYQLRAEAPGRFSALPAVAQGVYAPELRANSDEIKIGIVDREEN